MAFARRRERVLGLSLLAAVLACSSSSNPPDDVGPREDGGATDATNAADASPLDAGEPPDCRTLQNANFPKRMDVAGAGTDGFFDPTFALDPSSNRLWMVYSAVNGVAPHWDVSTHLAYSDDGGASWCEAGALNPSQSIPPSARPTPLAALDSHWNNEVPTIAYDADAPPTERWKVLWHRYIHAFDGNPDTEDRKIEYGWIGLKAAATPEGLFSAPERKLFSTLAYEVNAATRSYNDGILGAPEVRLHSLHPDLAGCIAVTESGSIAWNGALFVSLVCFEQSEQKIVLVKRVHSESRWDYVGSALDRATMRNIDPQIESASASNLYALANNHFLIVSPQRGALYFGCMVFQIDLGTGTLRDVDQNGPDVLLTLPPSSGPFQSGACAFLESLTATGIVFGETHSAPPAFRLFATGITP